MQKGSDSGCVLVDLRLMNLFESFGKKLSHLLQRWVDLSQTEKSYDVLFDFIMADQSPACISKDLAVFLRERDLTSEALIKHAESFRLAHPTNSSLGNRISHCLYLETTGTSANVAHRRGNVSRVNMRLL